MVKKESVEAVAARVTVVQERVKNIFQRFPAISSITADIGFSMGVHVGLALTFERDALLKESPGSVRNVPLGIGTVW